MKKQTKMRMGELLVSQGLISKEQLQQALDVQKNQKVYKPVGEICVELKFLSRYALTQALNKHKKCIRIGDLLLNLNLISQDQLQQALDAQKAEKAKLGKILVAMGFLTETSLLNALTIQLGVPKILPDMQLMDSKLLSGLSEEFLLKNEVIPAFRENGTVTVIMADPLDDNVINTLQRIFKARIETAIAPSTEILNAVRQHFRKPTLGISAHSPEEKKDLVIGDKKISMTENDVTISALDYIITTAINENASDIHIEPKDKNLRIRFRIDGILRHKTDLPISIASNLSSRIKAICGLDIAEKRRHQDGRIEARIGDQEVDLRISVYASVYGENIVIRVLRRQSELIDLDSLGISPSNRRRYNDILDQPAGVVLVTGPTGSGKTTMLYASLNYLNNGQRSIITVEDPVEYTIDGVVQGQLNPKLGHSYSDFIKSMMRQDPDVIMVGEIRDNTAASAVIQAALTGHKVLTTFHTDDSTGALLRLMDMGIDTFLISSTVVSVVAQRLVRQLCPACRRPLEPDPRLLSSFNMTHEDISQHSIFQPTGCSQCNDIGFKGRTAIHELLCVNDAIRDAILQRKTSSQIRMVAREMANLISMREDGFYKATQGITSLEEILRVVFYNESDEMAPRTPNQIIGLCEGVKEMGRKRLEAPEDLTAKPADTVPPKQAAITPSRETRFDGEVYRARFEVTSVESDTELIVDFFNRLQSVLKDVGKPIADELVDDFVNFVVYTAKRFEMSLKAEFIELFIRMQNEDAKILLETLVPEKQQIKPFSTSRETGIRLINFLMPTSGLSISAHRPLNPTLSPSKTVTSEPQPPQSAGQHGKGNRSTANVYKRHVEELEWKRLLLPNTEAA